MNHWKRAARQVAPTLDAMPRTSKKTIKRLIVTTGALGTILLSSFLYRHGVFDWEDDQPSLTYGSSTVGSMANGKSLPCAGRNFKAYSLVGCALRRNAVHSSLRPVLLESYDELSQAVPEQPFVYGETGWLRGGKFWPHKSHQNGLCVDFFVPVTKAGLPAILPVSPFNRFGYGIEFDNQGRFGEFVIDFETMGKHVLSLNRLAPAHNLRIRFVILDNELQNHLGRTPSGARALQIVRFSKLPPWVRHDEHYHIEFEPVQRGTASN